MNKIKIVIPVAILSLYIVACNSSDDVRAVNAYDLMDDESTALFDVLWKEDDSVRVVVFFQALDYPMLTNDDITTRLVNDMVDYKGFNNTSFRSITRFDQEYSRVINHNHGIVSLEYKYELLNMSFSDFLALIEKNINTHTSTEFVGFKIIVRHHNKGHFISVK